MPFNVLGIWNILIYFRSVILNVFWKVTSWQKFQLAWGKFVRTNIFRPIYYLFQANILTIETDQLICSAKWLPSFMRTFVGSSLSAGGPMISPSSVCMSVRLSLCNFSQKISLILLIFYIKLWVNNRQKLMETNLWGKFSSRHI